MEKFIARVDVASAVDDDAPGNVSDSVTPKAGASFLLPTRTPIVPPVESAGW